MESNTVCIICGADDECVCASDPGITAAAFALIEMMRSGDRSPQHRARVVEAQKRLVRAQHEAAQR